MEPLLSTEGLSKKISSSPALKQVNLKLFPGEVIGLVGESGSGRSLFCMLLSSKYTPDDGVAYFNGKKLTWPYQARSIEIETIHSTPNIVSEMDVTSNIFLGNEINWSSRFSWPKIPDRKKMDQEAKILLKKLGLRIDSLREKAKYLTSEQLQLICIARALTCNPKLIIVDSPAPLLSYAFEQKLLDLIQDWQKEGTSVIFNSNNLNHIFAVTDRIIVFRQGKIVADYSTDEVEREEVIAAIVGTTERQQLTPVIWALERYQQARERAEMLSQKQTLLEEDLAARDELNQQLMEQWTRQIEALDHANYALQDAQRRLLTEREEERKFIAREIHDLVIQDLLGINYQLEDIATDKENISESIRILSEIRESIQDLVDDLRHICGSLRPPTIDSLGLHYALQSLIDEWSRRTAIRTKLDLGKFIGRLPEEIELSVFRIVQEGLNNIRKHSDAKKVEIFLKHTSPRSLIISMSDDGKGLPDNWDLATLSVKGHYGLLGISERVVLLGGQLRIENRPEGGVLIEAEITHPKINDIREIEA